MRIGNGEGVVGILGDCWSVLVNGNDITTCRRRFVHGIDAEFAFILVLVEGKLGLARVLGNGHACRSVRCADSTLAHVLAVAEHPQIEGIWAQTINIVRVFPDLGHIDGNALGLTGISEGETLFHVAFRGTGIAKVFRQIGLFHGIDDRNAHFSALVLAQRITGVSVAIGFKGEVSSICGYTDIRLSNLHSVCIQGKNDIGWAHAVAVAVIFADHGSIHHNILG